MSLLHTLCPFPEPLSVLGKGLSCCLDNCNIFVPSLFGALQDVSAMGIVDLVGYKCETAPEMKKKK